MKLIYRSASEEEIKEDRFSTEEFNIHEKKDGKESIIRVELIEAYREFYNFKDEPFAITPDPKFFYFSNSHSEALNHLRYGIYEGMGFTLISGEPGTGKTILSRYFIEKSGNDLKIIRIFDPRISANEIINNLLGYSTEHYSKSEVTSDAELLERLAQMLLNFYRDQKRVVVLVDEAQTLGDETLEGLRLLSNLETQRDKLLHIVLFTQPELEERLKKRGLRQLDQRILVRYNLLPFEPEEIKLYIKSQLSIAAGDPEICFTSEAIKSIYRLSSGIPRLVNALCERALMSAFVDNLKTIQESHVLEGSESLKRLIPCENRLLSRIETLKRTNSEKI
ncbi:MAG: AAA family ATPase [candidate division Zixibacteria bacterium]|nr:AAA family ATPase [candidate division Zixibacteria bacterium]